MNSIQIIPFAKSARMIAGELIPNLVNLFINLTSPIVRFFVMLASILGCLYDFDGLYLIIYVPGFFKYGSEMYGCVSV